jgi:hypothetical protein
MALLASKFTRGAPVAFCEDQLEVTFGFDKLPLTVDGQPGENHPG